MTEVASVGELAAGEFALRLGALRGTAAYTITVRENGRQLELLAYDSKSASRQEPEYRSCGSISTSPHTGTRTVSCAPTCIPAPTTSWYPHRR